MIPRSSRKLLEGQRGVVKGVPSPVSPSNEAPLGPITNINPALASHQHTMQIKSKVGYWCALSSCKKAGQFRRQDHGTANRRLVEVWFEVAGRASP